MDENTIKYICDNQPLWKSMYDKQVMEDNEIKKKKRSEYMKEYNKTYKKPDYYYVSKKKRLKQYI